MMSGHKPRYPNEGIIVEAMLDSLRKCNVLVESSASLLNRSFVFHSDEVCATADTRIVCPGYHLKLLFNFLWSSGRN